MTTVQHGFLEFNGEIGCVQVCRVRMLNGTDVDSVESSNLFNERVHFYKE